MRKPIPWALCILVALTHGSARAQSDSDLDLLYSQKSVAPNIAIVLDNSGSMAHSVWPDDFDPLVFHDDGPGAQACPSKVGGEVLRHVGSDGVCPSSGDGNWCPNANQSIRGGDSFTCSPAAFPANVCALAPSDWGCSIGADLTFVLPDYNLGPRNGADPLCGPAGCKRTRWSTNYLAWILNKLQAGESVVVPQVDRLETAKSAVKGAIDAINPPSGPYNDNARFGLFAFEYGSNPAGADRKIAIDDTLSRTQLFNAIDDLRTETWTPLGESLIEVARYLSGNDALGVDSDLTQGSVITSPKAPIDDAECAPSFVIVLTDGESTQDLLDHSPFYTSSFWGSTDYFSSAIGDADGDGLDPAAPPTVAPYIDNGTDWMDDIAYYIYNNDLRPQGMPAGGELSGVQNISTYVIGFSIDHPLLQGTATNGGGKYFTVKSASALAAALSAAIDDILLRSASFSAASVPASRTGTGDALLTAYFEPSSLENFWPGHLEAYSVSSTFEILGKNGLPATDPTTGEFLVPRNRYFWDAQVCLSDPNSPCHVAARALYYGNDTPDWTRYDFDPGLVPPAMLGITSAELGSYPNDPAAPFANEQQLADAIVNYIHGRDAFDADRDSDTTELREAVLGDIFHSSPLALGAPSSFLASEPGYGPITGNVSSPAGFYDRYFTRSRTIYVGANDGVLHAFHGGDYVDPDAVPFSDDEHYELGANPLEGSERFGYVPQVVLPRLKNLVKLGEPKPLLVDGSPVVADAWLPGSSLDVTKDPDEWTSVLITGLRAGGAGYVALDVTDPSASATDPHGPYPKPLWEISDPNELLGETWSEPVVTRVKLRAGLSQDACGSPNDGDGDLGMGPDCRETWVAIFAGGYLAQGDPTLTASYIASPSDSSWTPDSRSIYMVNLESGEVIARIGYDPGHPELQYMTFSIPTQPAVADLNADGFADVVYFGDLGGQMWKWVISPVGAPDAAGEVGVSQWPIARFFTAPQGSNGHYRQIFYPPSLSMISGKLTIAFGTGERTLLDYDSTAGVDENHFYVIRDPNPLGPNALPSTPYTVANITQIPAGGTGDPDLTDLGYYLVGTNDEKFITESVAFGGFLITASYGPELNASVGPCETGGSAYLYIFSLSDGIGFFSNPSGPERSMRVGSGLPSSPQLSTHRSTGDTSVVIQTSRGQLPPPPPPLEKDPSAIDLLFWRMQ